MKDSRGNPSKTLTFVAISWAVMTVKFATAGLVFAGQHIPAMDIQSYGIAAAAILAPWIAREWKEKS